MKEEQISKDSLRGKWWMSKVIFFYLDGFRNMTVGRKLWVIIFIKLFIMFAVLKAFFFPNFLKTQFNSDQERSDYVIEQLIK